MNKRKIIYSILKEIEKGNNPSKEDYGMTFDEFFDIALFLKKEGLIRNETITKDRADFSFAQVTLRGMNYLDENSALAKTYKGLKEVRSWLPL